VLVFVELERVTVENESLVDDYEALGFVVLACKLGLYNERLIECAHQTTVILLQFQDDIVSFGAHRMTL